MISCLKWKNVKKKKLLSLRKQVLRKNLSQIFHQVFKIKKFPQKSQLFSEIQGNFIKFRRNSLFGRLIFLEETKKKRFHTQKLFFRRKEEEINWQFFEFWNQI